MIEPSILENKARFVPCCRIRNAYVSVEGLSLSTSTSIREIPLAFFKTCRFMKETFCIIYEAGLTREPKNCIAELPH